MLLLSGILYQNILKNPNFKIRDFILYSFYFSTILKDRKKDSFENESQTHILGKILRNLFILHFFYKLLECSLLH